MDRLQSIEAGLAGRSGTALVDLRVMRGRDPKKFRPALLLHNATISNVTRVTIVVSRDLETRSQRCVSLIPSI